MRITVIDIFPLTYYRTYTFTWPDRQFRKMNCTQILQSPGNFGTSAVILISATILLVFLFRQNAITGMITVFRIM